MVWVWRNEMKRKPLPVLEFRQGKDLKKDQVPGLASKKSLKKIAKKLKKASEKGSNQSKDCLVNFRRPCGKDGRAVFYPVKGSFEGDIVGDCQCRVVWGWNISLFVVKNGKGYIVPPPGLRWFFLSQKPAHCAGFVLF